MKKLLLLLAFLAGCTWMVSCSSDDGDDDGSSSQSTLTVDVAEINIPADGASKTFRITSNGKWTISGNQAWLQVTPSVGSGNAVVVVAATENTSVNGRECLLSVETVDGIKQTVRVSQAGNKASDCVVAPNTIVVLSDGFAFDYTYGKNVSYYYTKAFTPSKVDRMTEEEIVRAISEDDSNRNTPNDGYVTSWQELPANLDVAVFTLAYDKTGKRGELVRTDIKTKSDRNQPVAYISDVKYSDTSWMWSTQPNGYTKMYYMWLITNVNLLNSTDAAVAWFFNDAMSKSASDASINTPISGPDSWTATRSSNIFHAVTWAVDVNNEFSGLIERVRGTANSSSKTIRRSADKPGEGGLERFYITPDVDYLSR